MEAEYLMIGVILALTSVVAAGYIHIPVNPTMVPIVIAVLVIVALAAFAVYPMVGIALLAFVGVLAFQNNALAVLSASKASYGEVSIPMIPAGPAQPYTTTHVGPREYDQFNDTDGHNPMLSATEGFEPAPFDHEVGASVEGQFPIDEARASGSPDTRSYTYFPDEKTGSNEVDDAGIMGAGIEDEKLQAVGY